MDVYQTLKCVIPAVCFLLPAAPATSAAPLFGQIDFQVIHPLHGPLMGQPAYFTIRSKEQWLEWWNAKITGPLPVPAPNQPAQSKSIPARPTPPEIDFEHFTLVVASSGANASEWEATAMEKRPWRAEFFAKFADELAHMEPAAARVLELGSGPGFLASIVMSRVSDLRMTLLDFSEAMHALARQRLGAVIDRVEFLVRSFKDPEWFQGLDDFDAVIANQAVHELRHKRYAEELHRQVARVLRPGGTYLVCDHFSGPGGMTNDQLYMTAAEQKSAIESAGYASVLQVLLKGGMVLHRATGH